MSWLTSEIDAYDDGVPCPETLVAEPLGLTCGPAVDLGRRRPMLFPAGCAS